MFINTIVIRINGQSILWFWRGKKVGRMQRPDDYNLTNLSVTDKSLAYKK